MSPRHRLELADVFRKQGGDYLSQHGASFEQRRVLSAIQLCRTEALGGHVEECDRCGHRRVAYNSCRNRHCPKCQGPACAQWMQARAAELLPVPYFHVVFTLPETLAPLALQNKRVMYDLLFRAAAQTLQEVAADSRHLGARIGFLMVLHTWGQNLLHHPHVHCIVASGGLARDGSRWVAGHKKFLLPVRVLSRVFRGKYLFLLKRAFRSGKLQFHGSLEDLWNASRFEQRLTTSVGREWVVYAKPPAGGPEQVLKYLARYTHRVAISNRRLLQMKEGRVTFSYKDYADGNRTKKMTLAATEFIRRFLLHVLPANFMRIRHYGFMANRFRTESLARCRELLLHNEDTAATIAPTTAPTSSELESPSTGRCPFCHEGRMRIVEMLEPRWPHPVAHLLISTATGDDTS
jgi:Putative transposase/Transposase zinc-binding domain